MGVSNMAPLPRDRTCTARVCLERELLRTQKVDAAHRQRVRPKPMALRSGGRCPSFGSARSCVRGESTAWYVPHQGVRGEELEGARRRRQGTLGPGQQVGTDLEAFDVTVKDGIVATHRRIEIRRVFSCVFVDLPDTPKLIG